MKKESREKFLNMNKSLILANVRPLELDSLPTNINDIEMLWTDAFIKRAERTERQLNKRVKPVTTFRMGYILKEDDEMLLMAPEITQYPEDAIYFRDAIAIPKVNVIKIVRLSESR